MEKYRDKSNGYDTGAEHDVLYASSTDRPLSADDLKRMKELGWHQEGHSSEEDYYDPEEWWCAFT